LEKESGVENASSQPRDALVFLICFRSVLDHRPRFESRPLFIIVALLFGFGRVESCDGHVSTASSSGRTTRGCLEVRRRYLSAAFRCLEVSSLTPQMNLWRGCHGARRGYQPLTEMATHFRSASAFGSVFGMSELRSALRSMAHGGILVHRHVHKHIAQLETEIQPHSPRIPNNRTLPATPPRAQSSTPRAPSSPAAYTGSRTCRP
jgi:hypothetical protein